MSDSVANVLLAIPAVITMIEVLLYWAPYPRLTRLRKTFLRSVHVLISNRISEHWKERSLRHYAFIIMKEAAVLFGQTILSISILVGIYCLLGVTLIGSKFELIPSMLAVETQVTMIMLGIVYVALRRRIIDG